MSINRVDVTNCREPLPGVSRAWPSQPLLVYKLTEPVAANDARAPGNGGSSQSDCGNGPSLAHTWRCSSAAPQEERSTLCLAPVDQWRGVSSATCLVLHACLQLTSSCICVISGTGASFGVACLQAVASAGSNRKAVSNGGDSRRAERRSGSGGAGSNASGSALGSHPTRLLPRPATSDVGSRQLVTAGDWPAAGSTSAAGSRQSAGNAAGRNASSGGRGRGGRTRSSATAFADAAGSNSASWTSGNPSAGVRGSRGNSRSGRGGDQGNRGNFQQQQTGTGRMTGASAQAAAAAQALAAQQAVAQQALQVSSMAYYPMGMYYPTAAYNMISDGVRPPFMS